MSNFRQKTRLYKVYHIRLKGEEDLTKGYIGITRRSLPYRLSQHFCSTRPIGTVLRSLEKDQIEIVQLAMLPEGEAKEMEYSLRPNLNIGWNVRAGGGKATVCCPSCGKYLPKRKTGTYCMDCKNTQFPQGNLPWNYGIGEKYKLTSPEGLIFMPESFIKFCKENGLTSQNLRKVAKGDRKHHKGWKAERIG